MQAQLSDPTLYLPDWLLSDTVDPTVQYPHTSPLTKYERTMALGHRGLQVGQGSEPRVAHRQDDDPLTIARAELESGNFPPMSLLRTLPDGSVLRRTLDELYRAVRF